MSSVTKAKKQISLIQMKEDHYKAQSKRLNELVETFGDDLTKWKDYKEESDNYSRAGQKSILERNKKEKGTIQKQVNYFEEKNIKLKQELEQSERNKMALEVVLKQMKSKREDAKGEISDLLSLFGERHSVEATPLLEEMMFILGSALINEKTLGPESAMKKMTREQEDYSEESS